MINPSEIDIKSLPWLPLDARLAFPKQAAVYFAIDSQNNIQYIGKAIDLKARWGRHHRFHELQEIGGVRVAYLFVDDTSLLLPIEQALIAWFDPPLNIVGASPKPPIPPRGKGLRVTKTIVLDVPGLGIRIKLAREMDSRSLSAICREIGMSTMNWYRIEAEEQALPIETLRRIEEVLDIDFGVKFDD